MTTEKNYISKEKINWKDQIVEKPLSEKMTTIKEIEKGCGKNYWALPYKCGDNFVGLCPTCQAKLQTKKEDLEIIEKMKLNLLTKTDEFINIALDLCIKEIEGKQEDGE